MADERSDVWIDPNAAPEPDIEVEGGEVLIAPGQVGAFFPDQPKVTRWKDAEGNAEHRPIEVGPNAKCICGWKADGLGMTGWTQHFIEAVK